ncbi:MAG: hypothetical protein L6Q71_05295, partial [Planctomycetes bacterium]|nr:hypothetical protein [Planctomycetota bacterium]
ETKGVDGIAPEGKLCPFYKEGKCSARDVRPLGCRVYFCDKSYQKNHSQRIYEKYHAEIEALARESEVEYAYVPMVSALRRYAREGRFHDPARPFDFS